ncbi:MAG: ribonuclease activity regulator RraA [Thermoflexales bacterium]|nr:ribonuclease activity regulator RraA [Thermoflexales bacterium]
MIQTPDITRPDPALVAALQRVGTATAAGELYKLGIRNPHLAGLTTWRPGRCVAGPALTLQWMPRREDMSANHEYADPEMQLHRHVMYHTRPGDIIVVDARGDMASGVFGEMMLTYFKGRGGVGVVIDGCVRDWPHVQGIDLGFWMRGVTPNHGWQNGIMPFAVNAPIACAGVLVMPGDVIIADDDGAIVVPVALAPEVARHAYEKNEWETFTRLRLSQGGDLRTYYPLTPAAQAEYEAWRAAQGPAEGAAH